MKKTLITILAVIGIPLAVFATATNVNRIGTHIEPLINTDSIQSQFFTATSTTATSTFNGFTNFNRSVNITSTHAYPPMYPLLKVFNQKYTSGEVDYTPQQGLATFFGDNNGDDNSTSAKIYIQSNSNNHGQLQIGNADGQEVSLAYISGVRSFGPNPTSVYGSSYVWNQGLGLYGTGGQVYSIANNDWGPIFKIHSNNASIDTHSGTILDDGSGNMLVENDLTVGDSSGIYSTVLTASASTDSVTDYGDLYLSTPSLGCLGTDSNGKIINGTCSGTNYWTQSGATTTNTVANVASTLGVFGSIQATSTATSTYAGGIVATCFATSTGGNCITGGGGSGTVTSVSVTTANGVSGSVATQTTTPAITLTLGAITPTSVNGLLVNKGANALSGNTAVGVGALDDSNSGNGHNTAIGNSALTANTTGAWNTAIGQWTLNANIGGNYNTALGVGLQGGALYNNTSGSYNTAIGSESLLSNSTGSNNVALGFRAGYYETGSNAFYLNNKDQTNTAGDKAYSLLYGNFAGAGGTTVGQQLTINAATTTANSALIVNGNVGIGTTSPASKLTVNGHIGTDGAIPTLTSCGTSPSIVTGSTDTAGEVTEGTIATGCTITFASAYARAPFVTVTAQSGLVFSYTISASAITITNVGALSSTKLDYHVISNDL
jgi:hypothetical protein